MSASRIFGERVPLDFAAKAVLRRGRDPRMLRPALYHTRSDKGPYGVRTWVLVDESGAIKESVRFNARGNAILSSAVALHSLDEAVRP